MEKRLKEIEQEGPLKASTVKNSKFDAYDDIDADEIDEVDEIEVGEYSDGDDDDDGDNKYNLKPSNPVFKAAQSIPVNTSNNKKKGDIFDDDDDEISVASENMEDLEISVGASDAAGDASSDEDNIYSFGGKSKTTTASSSANSRSNFKSKSQNARLISQSGDFSISESEIGGSRDMTSEHFDYTTNVQPSLTRRNW